MDDVGVPVMLLQEFEKKKVIVDTNTGEIFQGTLLSADQSMNMLLSSVKGTFPSGHTAELESVYVRGPKVRVIQLPDEAKESVSFLVRKNPPFGGKGRGGGRGRGRGRGGGSRGGGGRDGGGRDHRDRSYDRRR